MALLRRAATGEERPDLLARILPLINLRNLRKLDGEAEPVPTLDQVGGPAFARYALAEIVDALHAGRRHPRPGGIERARQIDGPAGCLDEHGVEAKPARVHSGVMHAIVGREPGQEDPLQTALAQIASQTGRRLPVVFIERGIGIDFGAESLADHQLRPLRHQLRVKGGARRSLDTVIGPERLLAIWHADGLKGGRTRMRCGKGAVTGRMPILGQRDMIEALGEAIDDRYHGIAVGDRKRAAGAKIVLHVDYKQQIIVAEPDWHVAPASWLIRKPLAQSKGAIR